MVTTILSGVRNCKNMHLNTLMHYHNYESVWSEDYLEQNNLTILAAVQCGFTQDGFNEGKAVHIQVVLLL